MDDFERELRQRMSRRKKLENMTEDLTQKRRALVKALEAPADSIFTSSVGRNGSGSTRPLDMSDILEYHEKERAKILRQIEKIDYKLGLILDEFLKD